ncbi:MAG: riboflavin synthase [Nitrospirota bacterium]|nr:riboflavin synthase [Nitrospirota bacterium]
MFTGIVEELGSVRRADPAAGGGRTLVVACRSVLEGTRLGDSIMVNGACLTVTRLERDGFACDVSAESCRVTTLGQLAAGSPVNLERAMALGGRLGGHLVSGHVDGVGTVRAMRTAGKATEIWFDAPSEVLALTVEKGSICIEGVSLTVNALDATGFCVMIIPHTGSHTTLLSLAPGGRVNLEADLIGKYVQRLLGGYPGGKAAGLQESDLYKL